MTCTAKISDYNEFQTFFPEIKDTSTGITLMVEMSARTA